MKNRLWMIVATALLIFSAACSGTTFPAGDYKPAESNSSTPVVDLNLATDGTFTIAHYDGRTLAGTYAVAGDKLTLNDSKEGPCFGAPMTMSWESTGSTLSLKTFKDECSAAISFDLVGEWSRQP